MKPSVTYNLLYLFGAIFGYLGLFHASVGLPDWVQIPCSLIFAACVVTVAWLQRRAKKRGAAAIAPVTASQSRRQTWLLLIVLLVSCIVWPFLLPYTGVTLPFYGRVVISVITFVMFAPLIIIIRRRRETSQSREGG